MQLPDIPADAGQSFGALDYAGPDSDDGRLAEPIKQAAASAFGMAGPEFVRQLVATGAEEVKVLTAEMILSFVTTNLLSKCSQPECALKAACGCMW